MSMRNLWQYKDLKKWAYQAAKSGTAMTVLALLSPTALSMMMGDDVAPLGSQVVIVGLLQFFD